MGPTGERILGTWRRWTERAVVGSEEVKADGPIEHAFERSERRCTLTGGVVWGAAARPSPGGVAPASRSGSRLR